MIAYHVVTERPMVLGQQIVFDEDHHSGVYNRVMALADTVADVYTHPEKYPLPLEHHLDVAIRELAMEQVRQAKFPEYPSRMASLYVSSSYEAALSSSHTPKPALETTVRCLGEWVLS